MLWWFRRGGCLLLLLGIVRGYSGKEWKCLEMIPLAQSAKGRLSTLKIGQQGADEGGASGRGGFVDGGEREADPPPSPDNNSALIPTINLISHQIIQALEAEQGSYN